MLQVPSVTMNGRQPEQRDQQAVDQAAGEASQEAEREGDDDRHAVDHAGAAHHHRRQDHDHADADRSMPAVRMIRRLRHAQDGDDRHLLEDHRQVERRRGTFRARRSAKITTPTRRTMNGIEVGYCVQEPLQLAQRRLALFLEARHGMAAASQSTLRHVAEPVASSLMRRLLPQGSESERTPASPPSVQLR